MMETALQDEQIKMVSDLLDQGNVNPKGIPVHFAVRLQSPKLLKFLLDSNADVNEVDDLENTPVHLAVELENLDVLGMLVGAGAKLNERCAHGYTPLHVAACKSKILDIFRLLVAAGADVNARSTYKGYTPLHVATESAKACSILKLLMDAESSVELKGRLENTTLYEAAKDTKGVKALRELFNPEIGKECTPALFSFTDTPRNLDILKFLLDFGADVNARDEDGHSALHMAADFGDLGILKLLLDYGADVNARSHEGNTPLHYAISKDNLVNTTFLVDAGADVNVKNGFRDTPLHMATFSNEMHIIKVLIRAGANVDERTRQGDHTSFTYFVKSLHLKSRIKKKHQTEDIVKFMIDYTDINLVDASGANMLAKILKTADYLAKKKFFFKAIYEHIAKLKALGLEVHPSLMDFISPAHEPRVNYFGDCMQELAKAKTTKLKNSDLTYFNLLVDDKPRFVKYVENAELVKDFRKNKDFTIYKSWMQTNISQGIEGRKMLEVAASALSNCLLIFIPKHPIVRDVLDCLGERDWKRIAGKTYIGEQ